MVKNIALICAAGIGKRMESDIPKQYLKLNFNNKEVTILEITIEKFLQNENIDFVVVALNKNDKHFINLESKYISSLELPNYDRHLFATKNPKLYYCYGCGDRYHTVYSLLANAISLATEKNLGGNVNAFIHDAARCGITQEQINSLAQESESLSSFDNLLSQNCNNLGGILPASNAVDSIKEITLLENSALLKNSLNRDLIVLAQTPQVFNLYYIYYLLDFLLTKCKDSFFFNNLLNNNIYMPLKRTLESSQYLKALLYSDIANKKFKLKDVDLYKYLTDDVAVMLFFQEKVKVHYFNLYNNLKITRKEDLDLMQFFLNKEK